MGATISGVTRTISSVLVLLFAMDWKSLPRIGMSPMNGIFSKVSVSVVVQQAREDKALAVGQLDLGLHLPRGNGGHLKSGDIHGIGEVQRLTSGAI